MPSLFIQLKFKDVCCTPFINCLCIFILIYSNMSGVFMWVKNRSSSSLGSVVTDKLDCPLDDHGQVMGFNS